MIKRLLQQLARGERLSEAESYELFQYLIGEKEPRPTEAQIGAYFFATAALGVTVDELAGAAQAMMEAMVGFDVNAEFPRINLIDTCGTGGSGFNTFNTSTAVAFVVAASGQPVVKHGNRSSLSKTGSADMLEALGIATNLSVELTKRMLVETGFCFLFAPVYHPATKRVAAIRKELGIRTIFNYLGPLVNPARPKLQLLGVSNIAMVPVLCETLHRLAVERAMVVCGRDGLDEITLTDRTEISELRNGSIRSFSVAPEDFGLSRVSFLAIEGKEPDEAARLVRQIFEGAKGPYRDLVTLNAGAALYVADQAGTIADGVKLAEELIDSGRALKTLKQVLSISRTM